MVGQHPTTWKHCGFLFAILRLFIRIKSHLWFQEPNMSGPKSYVYGPNSKEQMHLLKQGHGIEKIFILCLKVTVLSVCFN